VDVVGDGSPKNYEAALKGVIGDPNVDGAMVFLSPQAPIDVNELADVIIAATEIPKPIFVNFLGGPAVAEGKAILSRRGIPNFPSPERAVNGFVAMNLYRKWLDTKSQLPEPFKVNHAAVQEVLDSVKAAGRTKLVSREAIRIIESYGISSAKSVLARNEDEAVRLAEEIGCPVVMKIVSPDIMHKTDAGGVRVGLRNEADIRRGYREICENALKFRPQAEIIGVEIQRLASGRECILGVNRDQQLGHLIMFGMGGIYTEVMKDVSFRLAPVSIQDAESMVREIKGFPVLAGTRNEKPSDIRAIEECLLRLSQLVTDFPDILEIDINPLMVGEVGDGGVAVDCRMIIS